MGAKITQKITPFLWFDDKAEEAANFYTSIFKNSKIGKTTRYDEEAGEATGRPAGSVMTVEFELEGQQFVGLNGGPMFKFTEAISFVVNCETQEEVDYFWSKLSAGGEESRCGWLRDKFGVSWQVVPVVLIEMLADEDTAKAKRVTHAMLQMDKIDIPTLKKAYETENREVSQRAEQSAAVATGEISRLADHLFRHEAGKLISVLTGIFGINRLQFAEDVVQESLVRALRTWPYVGIPKNPAAWLTQTAKNLALDLIRRENLFHDKEPQIIAFMEQWPSDSADAESPRFESEIRDSRLRLMFACCHPTLSPEDQTALALKILCGFSPAEIAKAFLNDRSSYRQAIDAGQTKDPRRAHPV